jgi:hypothetical protein
MTNGSVPLSSHAVAWIISSTLHGRLETLHLQGRGSRKSKDSTAFWRRSPADVFGSLNSANGFGQRDLQFCLMVGFSCSRMRGDQVLGWRPQRLAIDPLSSARCVAVRSFPTARTWQPATGPAVPSNLPAWFPVPDQRSDKAHR